MAPTPSSRPRGSRAARLACAGLAWAAWIGTGGRTAGQEVVLVGHLVDEKGAALAPDAVDASLDERTGEFISVWMPVLESDGAGGFRIALDAPEAGSERVLVLTRQGPAGPGARLVLSELGPGTHRLGPVRFTLPPDLAAGRVLGSNGATRSGVEVQLERRWIGPREGPATWNPLVGIPARTDSGGRYVLRAWSGTDELRAVVTRNGWTLAAREFRPGDLAVDLTLADPGALGGSLLLDASRAAGAVWVQCFRAGRECSSFAVGADGNFLIPDLEPGTYELHVRAQDDRAPLLKLEGIAVPAGGTAADSRLSALDLRGKLRCLRIEVRLPSGEPPPFATAFVRPRGEEEFRPRSVQGSFEVASGAPSVDLVLDFPGWRIERLSGVDSDRTVDLRPGLPVRITLRAGPPVLPEGFALCADLEPQAREWKRYGDRTAALDRQGTVLLRASEPGPHVPRILVRRLASGEATALPEGATSPAVLEIEERADGAELSVSLDLDPARLERLLEQLQDS